MCQGYFCSFLSKQLNRFRGTMSVYQNNISKNKIDLKQVQYKDIDKRYFDQLIQLKVGHFADCLDVFFVTHPNLLLTWTSCYRLLKWQTRTWTDTTMHLTSELFQLSFILLFGSF
jgi:hypothetical protein